ncbi:MAG: EutP/PduV family microcompartment system protein [Eubacteriales bacterium]|nr:EutP/PduV family microcompartment system protein [Eubacteriales bacterium]
MKTRIILIGRSMAGKTTLCQYLMNEELNYKKTQTIQVLNNNMVDTPGEYMEHRFWGALSVTAADADHVVLVQQATEKGTMFPPGYAHTLGKPCIGVVTKCDLGSEEEIEDAKKYLKLAGAQTIFVTSSYTGQGFDEFLQYFEEVEKSHA